MENIFMVKSIMLQIITLRNPVTSTFDFYVKWTQNLIPQQIMHTEHQIWPSYA